LLLILSDAIKMNSDFPKFFVSVISLKQTSTILNKNKFRI